MDVAAMAGREASGHPVPEDLRRPGLLGRFPPETEKRYFAWYVDQVKPLVRIIAFPSIVMWSAIPFLFRLWVGNEPAAGVYVMCWAVAVPVLIAVLVVSYTDWRSVQIPVAVLAVLVIAAISFNAFYHYFSVPLEAGILGTIIWLDTVVPFVRAPFRLAVLVTVMISATGSAYLLAAVHELNTPRENTWPYFSLVLITTLTVPLMCLVSEQSLRQRYVDEQIIERQHAELTASRELIRRYAPGSVVDRLEHGDDTVGTAQRHRVTIFFADIVGFTAMADRVDPEALAEIMNDYLGAVAEVIDSHGGTLNEFAGDGVMAIFGAPEPMDPEAQARAALAAARELQTTLPTWSQRWYRLGIDQDLKARIGINTGVVSVGTFGSAVRATYTGIGLQTNIAARVQSQCPPGSVLLSATTWHLVKDEVACEPRGEVEVKGVHFPIAMYEPAWELSAVAPSLVRTRGRDLRTRSWLDPAHAFRDLRPRPAGHEPGRPDGREPAGRLSPTGSPRVLSQEEPRPP